MKVEYEIDLAVDWSDKELRKIKEIKGRRPTANHNNQIASAPWDDEKIKHFKIIKAMCLLEECGISRAKIAKLFNVTIKTVGINISRNRGWG